MGRLIMSAIVLRCFPSEPNLKGASRLSSEVLQIVIDGEQLEFQRVTLTFVGHGMTHALSRLDAFLAYHPTHRRSDFGVAVIEQGLIELSLRLLNFRFSRHDILLCCVSGGSIGID